MNTKKASVTKQQLAALNYIAGLGHGIRDEMRDWANIGRNAVTTARTALAGRCKCCGKPNEWKPKAKRP